MGSTPYSEVTRWISTQFRALVLTVTFFALMVSSDRTVALNTILLYKRGVISQDELYHRGLVVSKHMRFRRREISFTSSGHFVAQSRRLIYP